VTNGAQQAFQLVARLLVQPGTVVAMEYPGYGMARSVFVTHGATVVDVPVDGEGLVVKRLPSNARVVFTTPSHQFPTGVAMSYARRLALLEWARARGAAIVEDDYDSEFRFDGRPVESLQGMDPSAVIYVGTFSKSLFPALRLGFVVAPAGLTAAMIAARQLADWHSPLLSQAATAAFLTNGHFARHIRKMRSLYADRRERLLLEVERGGGSGLEVIPSSTGLHVAARLKRPLSSAAVVAAASDAGIRIHAMPDGITFGLGAIDASAIKTAVDKLRKVLRTMR
jgi:GntR family transcriptional regulator/MocR family aminotransferase